MSIFNYVEDDLLERLVLPYVCYPQQDIRQRKILAWHVNSLSGDELLLPSAFLFSYAGIVAGINEKQIEYVAKNAPSDYKKELLTSILNEYRMKEVFEIAKMMDEDMGEGVMQNQKRIKNVQRYISDNWAVFQF